MLWNAKSRGNATSWSSSRRCQKPLQPSNQNFIPHSMQHALKESNQIHYWGQFFWFINGTRRKSKDIHFGKRKRNSFLPILLEFRRPRFFLTLVWIACHSGFLAWSVKKDYILLGNWLMVSGNMKLYWVDVDLLHATNPQSALPNLK